MLALAVGVVHHFFSFFLGNGETPGGARDQRRARCIAEHMEDVLARGEHRLGAASNDHRVAAAGGLDDDALGDFDQALLAGRQGGVGGAGQDLGRAQRKGGGEPLGERRNALFAGFDFGRGRA